MIFKEMSFMIQVIKGVLLVLLSTKEKHLRGEHKKFLIKIRLTEGQMI